MARPLKVSALSGPNDQNISLKEMNDTEIYNGIIYQILREFATTSGVGSLVNPQSGASNIGSWVDTYRQYSPGQHGFSGVDNVLSTTTTVAQLTGTVAQTYTRPMTYNNRMIEMTDAEINTYIIDPALGVMTNGGIGSYFMSSTTPTHIAGGTWQQVFTFTDTNYTNTTVGQTAIWRLTNITAPTSTRPLFWNGSTPLTIINAAAGISFSSASSQIISIPVAERTNALKIKAGKFISISGTVANNTSFPIQVTNVANDGSTITITGKFFVNESPANTTISLAVSNVLKELDDASLKLLVQRFRNRIAETGVGTYTLQYSPPGYGSWAAAGNSMYDIRSATNVQTYVGAYTGYYTGMYTGYYSGAYAGAYAGNYNLMYGGSVGGTYTGYYTGYYTGAYTGYYPHTYAGTYVGGYAGTTIISSNDVVSSIALWVRRY